MIIAFADTFADVHFGCRCEFWGSLRKKWL